MNLKYFFTAADIQMPVQVLDQICVQLDNKKENIYLVSEKSTYSDKRQFYTELKTYLDSYSVLIQSNKQFKIFNFVDSNFFLWAKTVSTAQSTVLWIPKKQLVYFLTESNKSFKKTL